MFEHKTYQYLLAQALARAPAGIDTRQGSIYRDSMAGQMLVLASMYVDLENIIKLLTLDTAEDEYLDDIASMFNMERTAATLATYEAVLTPFPGTAVAAEEGSQFFADDLYFGLYYDETGAPYFECETPGTAGNYVQEGTEANPVTTIGNLQSATFGAQILTAIDVETDDAFRERIKVRLRTLAENGNKEHYKYWCEQVEGVGHARIVPLWMGPNTVKGIIFGTDGGAASADVIAAVQQYVDPDDDGDGYGDGLGEGAANLGAHFTAVAPTTLTINISATLLLADGADLTEVTARIQASVEQYLNQLDRNSNYGATVRYYQISSIIMEDDGVLDHSDLLVNGDTENILVSYENVCALGELDLTTGEGGET